MIAPRRLTDLHCEWIANYLDETSLRYGDQIKKLREAEDGPFGVRQLWLNDNPITEAGIMFIADALKNNQTLEELYLHYTAIGDKGLQVPCETAARTRRLLATGVSSPNRRTRSPPPSLLPSRTLALPCPSTTTPPPLPSSRRWQHLLEMLNENKTLKKLELGACGITEKGANAIIKAFSPGGCACKNNVLFHMGLFANADEIDDNLPHIYDLLEEEARAKRG